MEMCSDMGAQAKMKLEHVVGCHQSTFIPIQLLMLQSVFGNVMQSHHPSS